MKNPLYPSVIFLCTLLFAVACTPRVPPRPVPAFPSVNADAETDPATSRAGDDAADDPAIWVNPTDPARSVVIGTVKKFGLEVYDLQGRRLHAYPIGRPNNIDVRYDFPLNNGQKVDIVACSERNTNEIMVFGIQPSDFSLKLLSAHRLKSSLAEVYGFCLYKSPVSKQYYCFLNGKNGSVEQWLLTPHGTDEISGEVVRTFRVATQPEGMVADETRGIVYVGEEDTGVWKFMAEPNQPTTATLLPLSTQSNPNIAYDVEGLTIYYAPDSTGYLIVSSQGNNSYAVFELQGNNKYLGNFTIGKGAIDGTSITDGIDVTHQDLGGKFKSGMFIAQDDHNTDDSGKSWPQNFKLVAWEKIAKAISQF